MMRPFVFLSAALLLTSSTASGAEVFANVGGGGGVSIDRYRRMVVVHAGGGVLQPVSPNLSVGARARVHLLPSSNDGSPWGATGLAVARLSARLGSLRVFSGVGLGYGVWAVCITGDWCGGAGASGNLELGLDVPLATKLRAEAALELAAQSGMVNGVEVLLLPSVSLGLRY